MAAKKPSTDTPPPPRFEEALGRLETIVHELEEGQLGLEDALARWEQGIKLLRHASALLNRAERRIELLEGLDAEGRIKTSPLGDEPESLEDKAAGRSRRRSVRDDPLE